ncbi:DUF3397 domain-containing protein [Falsibacillus pallidus]|uniref:Uncharacterized protein DUF3397 n=1 Tax=Falsibacillus pallidus TaxID=493781 RepID=A0A370GWC6_9BACI|nr:DUF3397 domain-containing protein [Falsibacillus pallidus]RDI47560.1 uncharacterized protein DUF3397 [Falsibacillus pallidus]
MGAFFSNVAAVFIIMPFLGYLAAFILIKQFSKNHKKAVHSAIDFTTFLLFLSVHYTIVAIWKESYIWLLCLFALSVGVVFVVIYWKAKGEIIFAKVLKGYWRLNFVIFIILYIVLLIYGLTNSLVQGLS